MSLEKENSVQEIEKAFKDQSNAQIVSPKRQTVLLPLVRLLEYFQSHFSDVCNEYSFV